MRFKLNQDNTKLILTHAEKGEYNQLKLFLTRKVNTKLLISYTNGNFESIHIKSLFDAKNIAHNFIKTKLSQQRKEKLRKISEDYRKSKNTF